MPVAAADRFHPWVSMLPHPPKRPGEGRGRGAGSLMNEAPAAHAEAGSG